MLKPGGLVDQLRLLRTGADLTRAELERRAGFPQAKVSKVEAGKQLPSSADTRAWADACGAGRGATDELLALLGEVGAVHLAWRGWWDSNVQIDHLQLATDANTIRTAELIVIPGALQTTDYAMAALRRSVNSFGAADQLELDRSVAARLTRGQLLRDPSRAWQFVVSEAALRIALPGRAAMSAQLLALVGALELDHVDIAVVPFTAAPVLTSFDLYLGDGLAVAVSEIASGEVVVEGKDAIEPFSEAFNAMVDAALTGPDARRLILEIADEHRHRLDD